MTDSTSSSLQDKKNVLLRGAQDPWFGTLNINDPLQVGWPPAVPPALISGPVPSEASGAAGSVSVQIISGVPWNSGVEGTHFIGIQEPNQKVFFGHGLVPCVQAIWTSGDTITQWIEINNQDATNQLGHEEGCVVARITAPSAQFMHGVSMADAVQGHSQDLANALWNANANNPDENKYWNQANWNPFDQNQNNASWDSKFDIQNKVADTFANYISTPTPFR